MQGERLPGSAAANEQQNHNAADAMAKHAAHSNWSSRSGEQILMISPWHHVSLKVCVFHSRRRKHTMATVTQLHINGAPCRVLADAEWSLLQVLRHYLYLTGRNHFCDEGKCCTRTVRID